MRRDGAWRSGEVASRIASLGRRASEGEDEGEMRQLEMDRRDSDLKQ